MKPVCLDTHVIIWGIKHEADPGQEDMITRATALIKSLDSTNTQMIIPSIVLAELLTKIPPEEREAFVSELSSDFMIYPFGIESSISFSDLWAQKKSKYKQDLAYSREHMKADFMIVATALSSSSSCIYSEDKGVQKASENLIECKNIPQNVLQLDFSFTDSPPPTD